MFELENGNFQKISAGRNENGAATLENSLEVF